MNRHKHVVEIFLWDRPNWEMTEEYLMNRLAFFHRYTLRSLLNQSANNFDILLQLGDKHKHITKNYNFHDRVIPVYDFGVDYYKKIDKKYLIITRIDSDDLFHINAIKQIKKFARKNIHKKKRFIFNRKLTFVFKKNLCWDMLNNCIIPHERTTSPFITKVYVRSEYQDWEKFKKIHFAGHDDIITGYRTGIELPAGHALVTKHNQNVSHLKRNVEPLELTEKQKKILQSIGPSDVSLPFYDSAIWDRAQIREILSNFGIENINFRKVQKELREKNAK